MADSERLTACFIRALGIPAEHVTDELAFNSIPEWKSRTHLILVNELEIEFNIMFDTEDILKIDTVGSASQIVDRYLEASIES